MSLEVKAQVEQRLTQKTFGAEKQSDEQTAQPTIAIEKGVDGLELHVDKTCLYENGQLVFFVVKKMLEEVQTLHCAFRRWGNKFSISRTATANPIL